MVNDMYMHLTHKGIDIHTSIDYIYCTTDIEEGIGSTSIDVSDVLTIFIHTNDIDYLSVFDDDGKRVLLIKDGDIKKRNNYGMES